MSDFGRRHRAPLLAAAILGTCLASTPAAEAQTWRTVSSARQVWDEKDLNVHLEYAAGKLTVAPAEGSMLYRLNLRYDQDQFTPVTEYQRDRGSLRLGVKSRKREGTRINDLSGESSAELALAPGIPIDLRLEFGAGEAELDLGGLSLRNADISTGASETRISFDQPNRIAAEEVEIKAGAAELRVEGLGNARAERIEFAGGVGETLLDFSGEWTRNASVAVKMGVGSLKLRIPRDVGVKVTRNSLLASFDADGLTKRGDAYFSPNWESAAQQLSFTIDAAFGSIEVEWID